MKSAVSIVCPTYNEAGIATEMLQKLYEIAQSSFPHFEIIVLDDDSTDRNFSELSAYAKGKTRLSVISQKPNQGTAITIRKLYTLSKYPLVLIFSLDGEWDPADVVRLYERQQRDDMDIVIGARQQKQYTIGRKLVSALYNAVSPLLFGVKTYDAGSIKILRRKLVETIPISSVGVFDEAERIIRASKQGYRITSIPIMHLPTKKPLRSFPRVDLVIQAVKDMVYLRFTLSRS